MCTGLTTQPYTAAEHVSRHMVDILRVSAALRRRRQVSISELKAAHENAEEVMSLLDTSPSTMSTPEERQQLQSFLTSSGRILERAQSKT